MNNIQAFLAELKEQGLRVVREDEPGWWYIAWCGSEVWVTRVEFVKPVVRAN